MTMNKEKEDECPAPEFNPRVMLRAVEQYTDRPIFEDLRSFKFAPYGKNEGEWSPGPSVRLV